MSNSNCNFCDRCNVELDLKLNNCPLCGRNITNYASTVHTSTSTYPNTASKGNAKNVVLNIIFMFLLCITLASFALEFFITNHLLISYYVLFGFFVVYIAILLPIKHNFSLSFSSIIALISVISYMLFIELFSNTIGWGIQYAIPLTLLAYSIYNAILIVAKGYFNFEYFLPVLISGILSTANLIVCYLLNWVVWTSLSAFSVSWFVIIFVVGIKYKKLKNNIKKKFHL